MALSPLEYSVQYTEPIKGVRKMTYFRHVLSNDDLKEMDLLELKITKSLSHSYPIHQAFPTKLCNSILERPLQASSLKLFSCFYGT